jgi:hypothetical protein
LNPGVGAEGAVWLAAGVDWVNALGDAVVTAGAAVAGVDVQEQAQGAGAEGAGVLAGVVCSFMF